VRSNRTAPEVVRSFEHEMTHRRNGGPIVSALKREVDLDNPVAQRVISEYNDFLAQRGQLPLTEDAARKEIVAPFLAADPRYGDLSAAFTNPDAAIRMAKDYHVPGGSAGSFGGPNPGLSFEPGEVGETDRARAPPVKLTAGPSADKASEAAQPMERGSGSASGLQFAPGNRTVTGGARLQPYGGPGGGHHVPAKSAFDGEPNYGPNSAPAIPNTELGRLKLNHGLISGGQQIFYRKFAKTGQKLTWNDVEAIEIQALIRGGMKNEIAKATVRNAIKMLKKSGVAGPTRIPWKI